MSASSPALSPIAALVRRHDPDRFLTTLFAPPEHREALLTLYAFDHELARAVEVTSEPHLALIRLQWWREVVEGARRRHEVATPLAALLDAGRLPADLVAPVIDAYETETRPEIETLSEWRSWLLEGPGGIGAAAAHLLGAADLVPARYVGAAHGAARLVRFHHVLARRGRCLLPAELLAGAGISIHDAIANPGSPAVASVLRQIVTEANQFLVQIPRRVRRAHVVWALPAVLARRDLRRGPRPGVPARGLGDQLAVIRAGLTARI
jgi:phytoene synthase